MKPGNEPLPSSCAENPDPPEPPVDREFVDRCLEGDLVAFETLVERYQKAIFHIALYKCRNYFDAEDLTQDIFLAAFRALPTLKNLDNFGGWLFGIAHNRTNKWYQRRRTKIIKFQELQRLKIQEARQRPAEVNPEPGAPRLLSDAMEKLPSELRQVLVLKYLEGKSYQAIESKLGINAHRIDYLIRKGKEILRKKIGPEGREQFF